MLVTCPDVTVMWLLGHFTHIQCGTGWVQSLSVHGHVNLDSHTLCVRLHVVITEHTHTVINILTACFMVQAVSWQPIIVETQLQSQACILGFVVEKVALRQVLYTSTSVSLSIIPPMLCAFIHLHRCYVVFGTGSIVNPLNVELNPICHLLALLGAKPYSPH